MHREAKTEAAMESGATVRYHIPEHLEDTNSVRLFRSNPEGHQSRMFRKHVFRNFSRMRTSDYSSEYASKPNLFFGGESSGLVDLELQYLESLSTQCCKRVHIPCSHQGQ